MIRKGMKILQRN